MSRIRVLIADDHEDVLTNLMDLLRLEFDVVGAVGDGQSLISAAKTLKPDVIVTDISMPQMDGISAASQIIKENSEAKIILLTHHDSSMFVRMGFEVGALGYVLKTRIDKELTEAIREVHIGNHFVSRGALLREFTC
jgi:DNA-binding NarL/FixJ family response regulator